MTVFLTSGEIKTGKVSNSGKGGILTFTSSQKEKYGRKTLNFFL